jgi:two-component system, chemotaxis family, chemotaxis protein CheY
MIMSTRVAGLKILLVEDQLETQQMIRAMLGDLGAQQIHNARDGREALDLLGEPDNGVDLVLCDWNMPRMSGLDLLKQVRSVDPSMPFLMITGRADVGDVMAAKQSGVSAYIRKPFTAEELSRKLMALARIVAHRRESPGAA